MGRIARPKNKLARRESVDLSLKTFGTKAHSNLLKRLNIAPGFKTSGRRRGSKVSDYGRQLREKQKVKKIYGLSENKMQNYFQKSVRTRGNTADFLIKMLESRLDNIVYRLRFAPTRTAARQLVAHGHIKVNGRKVSVPSYQIKAGDKIEFGKEKTKEIPYIKELLDEKNVELPKWLKRKNGQGEVVRLVELDEYAEPVNMALVIEFYSKL